MMKQNIKMTLLVMTMLMAQHLKASVLPDVNTLKDDNEQLIFAFELVRHGARTPLEDRDLDKFKVEEGMLTAEGMRQRYLLGRYNRKRYTETFKLLSEEYEPSEIYI